MPSRIPLRALNDLEVILQSAADSTTGVVLYTCEKRRATYLSRWFSNLRMMSAADSLVTYEPGNPYYALGMYWEFSMAIVAKGLLIRQLRGNYDLATLDMDQLILKACATGEQITLTFQTKSKRDKFVGKFRRRMNRLPPDMRAIKEMPKPVIHFTDDPPRATIQATRIADSITEIDMKDFVNPRFAQH